MYDIALTLLMLFFCLAVIYGGFCDLAEFKIPNRVSYSLAGLFVIYALLVFFSTPYFPRMSFYVTPMAWNAIYGLAVFVIMFVAWQLRWVGGGDVKFVTAMSFWMGQSHIMVFLILLLVFSALYALGMKLLLKWNPYFQISQMPEFLKRALHKVQERVIPYGVPAALAGLIAGVPAIGSQY
jgi:prepilin peptidase CpaA